MRRTTKERALHADGTPKVGQGTMVGAGAVALGAAALMAYLWANAPPQLDASTLCPVKRDPKLAVTVLLIDPSTPLNAQHRTELRRLMREMGTPGTPMHVPIGGQVVGYHLPPVSESLDQALTPTDAFCNPGGRPEDRRAVDDLTEGELHAQHRWRQFTQRLEGLFPTEETPKQGGTPLLETLALLSARHAHSAREADGRRMHLIVWSDLLQNTPYFTQYVANDETPAQAWLEDPANAHLRADMRGVDTSVFRLERPDHERFQTDHHFKWWVEVLTGMGATVKWQESI